MHRYLTFSTICLTFILLGISATSVAVAFPVITSQFGASVVEAGWVLSVYQLTYISALPLAAKASYIFGKRTVFVVSALLFTAGSALCAIAPNIQLLVLSRALQGMGAGAYTPVGIGIVADAFTEERQKYIGLTSSIYPIGQIIGPSLGGWMVSVFGWRSVFWFNVPMGLAILVLAIILIRPGVREKGRMDLLGGSLLVVSLFALMTGVTRIGGGAGMESGVSWGFPALLLVVAVVLMVFFVRRIKSAREPIVDWEILSGRPFIAANVYNFVCGAYYTGLLSFVPLYAVSIYGMSTVQSGLVMAPWSAGVMIAAGVSSFFLGRWGYRRPMVAGSVIAVIGLLLLALELPGLDILGLRLGSVGLLVGINFLLGIGTGVTLPAANNACIELMPNRVAGITGVRYMCRNIGGAIGIAAISLVLNEFVDPGTGFRVSFFFLAAAMLAALPLIFRMPKSPQG